MQKNDRVAELASLREIMGTASKKTLEEKTRFVRGGEEIKVELIVGSGVNWYRGMFVMATSTWGGVDDSGKEKWNKATVEARKQVVLAVLQRKALPLALELPQFLFEVRGCSRSAFDQIARARVGVTFASMGVRDNAHPDIDVVVPPRVFDDPQALSDFIAGVKASKRAYVQLLDRGQKSWQDARAVLPMGMMHRFCISINYAALSSLCSKRLQFCEQYDTVAVAWKLRQELGKHYALLAEALRPGCDFAKRCLWEATPIETSEGVMSIGEIVRHKKQVSVKSLQGNQFVYKPVIGWYKSLRANRKMVRVEFVNGRRTRNGRRFGVEVTEDHQFLTLDGWKNAASLTSVDRVITGRVAPNSRQWEIIEGSMLGDGSAADGSFGFTHKRGHESYIKVKQQALASLGATVSKNGLVVRLSKSSWSRELKKRWYGDGRKKNNHPIPRDIQLTPMTLAVWYMDDGNMGLTSAGRPRVSISIGNRSREDGEFLVEKLKKLGFNCRLNTQNGIVFTVESSEALLSLVGPYAPESMRYKIGKFGGAFDPSLWETGDPVPETDFVEISTPREVVANRVHVYCIDVADTHNFVTPGGVVHNCTYHEAYSLSEAFGCLFRGCGRWEDPYPYYEFNESAADVKDIETWLGEPVPAGSDPIDWESAFKKDEHYFLEEF